MNEKHQKKNHTCLSVRRPFICFFLALGVFLLSAFPTELYAQKKTITLDYKELGLMELFKKIEEKSDYVFFYYDVLIDKDVKVPARFKNMTVEQILDKVFANMELAYSINKKQITIKKKVLQEKTKKEGQSSIVKGVVFDQSREPLPGVSIVVQGTNIGTVSDLNGAYSIHVPSDDSKIIFSYIGFAPVTYSAKEMNKLSEVVLVEDTKTIDEVVVVGYTTRTREKLISSVSTINNQELVKSTVPNLENALTGRVSGVFSRQTSAEPGSDGADLKIRGFGSALVVVDGIPGRNYSDIDPSEIESVSVLKDASATAVYGVRGANGVILVQTKRGKLGKPTVNVHFEQSFTQPTKLPQYIGSAEYLTLLNEIAKDNGQQQSPYSQETIDHYINRTDPDLYPDVNWMDLITKDFAMNQRADITVNGGSDILRYAVVGSYYGEQGIFERDKSQSWNSGTHLNKFNLRSNVDINITKTTQLTVSVGGYLQEMNKMAISSDDAFSGAFETPPFIHPAYYKEDDNIYFPVVNQRVNPYVQVTQKGYATTSQSKIESLFALEQDLKFITPGLKIKGIFSFDRYSWSGVTRSKTPDLYQPATQRDENGNLILNISSYGQQFLSTSENNDWGNKATYVELNLNYERTFGKHQVEGLFLYN